MARPSTRRASTIPLTLLVLLLASSSAGAAPGDYDPTFDGDGYLQTEELDTQLGTAVAVQPDGRIIVVGRGPDDNGFAVARLEANGSFDMSFGVNGVAIASLGYRGAATAVTLAPDGKIIVAGSAFVPIAQQFAIARLDANGNVDPTFGTGGATVTDVVQSTDELPRALVRLPSGAFVVGGLAASGGTIYGVLVGYDENGHLDTAFGESGVVLRDEPSEIAALAFSRGIILAAGTTDPFGESQLMLARYHANGSAAGVTNVPLGFGGGGANAIAVDPNGGAVVAGWAGGCDDTMLARFAANGALDPNFGTGGVSVQSVEEYSCTERASALALQPDGRILVATFTSDFGGPPLAYTTQGWFLARFDRMGALDPSFDGDGVLDPLSGAPGAMALQPDGKVVTAGSFTEIPPPIGAGRTFAVVTRNEAVTTACDSAPRAACAIPTTPGGSALGVSQLAGKTPKLAWSWKKGSATLAELGDPTISGATYAFCGYDGSSSALLFGAQVESGGTCKGKPCWKPTGTSGWQYKDSAGTQWGIDKIKLKAGAGTAQLSLQGKHGNLPHIPLPSSLPLRVQLQAPSGACFEAVFSSSSTNDAARLKAKSD